MNDVYLQNVCESFAKAVRNLIGAPYSNETGGNEVRNLICNLSAFHANNEVAEDYVGERGVFWDDWKVFCSLDNHDPLNLLKCAYVDYEFGVDVDDYGNQLDVGHMAISVGYDTEKTGDSWFDAQLESLVEYYAARNFSLKSLRQKAITYAETLSAMIADWAHGMKSQVRPNIYDKWQVLSVYDRAMELLDYEVHSHCPRLFQVGLAHGYHSLAEFVRAGYYPEVRNYIPFLVVMLKNALIRLVAILRAIQHRAKLARQKCKWSTLLLQLAATVFTTVFDVYLEEADSLSLAKLVTARW